MFSRNVLIVLDSSQAFNATTTASSSSSTTLSLRKIAVNNLLQVLDRVERTRTTTTIPHHQQHQHQHQQQRQQQLQRQFALLELNEQLTLSVIRFADNSLQSIRQYLRDDLSSKKFVEQQSNVADDSDKDAARQTSSRVTLLLRQINRTFARANRVADVNEVWLITTIELDDDIGRRIASDELFERNVAYFVYALRPSVAKSATAAAGASSSSSSINANASGDISGVIQRVARGADNVRVFELADQQRLQLLLSRQSSVVACVKASSSLLSYSNNAALTLIDSAQQHLFDASSVRDARFAVHLRLGHQKFLVHLLGSHYDAAEERLLAKIVARSGRCFSIVGFCNVDDVPIAPPAALRRAYAIVPDDAVSETLSAEAQRAIDDLKGVVAASTNAARTSMTLCSDATVFVAG